MRTVFWCAAACECAGMAFLAYGALSEQDALGITGAFVIGAGYVGVELTRYRWRCA